MKITKIVDVKDNYRDYEVTFAPNWFEKLLGYKEKTKKYRNTGDEYTFGGGKVYIKEDGSILSNGNWIGEAIDNFRRKF